MPSYSPPKQHRGEFYAHVAARAEFQRIKDATAAEQVLMLEADYNSFVQQEQEAKAYQRKFQSTEAWATTQHNRFAETIKAGDLLYAKK